MNQGLEGFLEKLKHEAGQTGYQVGVVEEGRVVSAGDGIVSVSGLQDAKLYELVSFEDGSEGIVFDLDREALGVIVLVQGEGIGVGTRAFKTERIASVAVGDWILGRMVDPLGNPLDGLPGPEEPSYVPVERQAPSLVQREYVTTPLYTGLRVIDSMLPIGRGQRELIIGDSSTGKTAIAIDTIINQKNSDVICVYAAIGQKQSRVLRTLEEVKKYGDFSRVVFLVAGASDSLGLQYIAPYSATSVAEYFMDKGRDVLVVYDDLTRHAEAYRSLSLLLKRPPGREAFPGDIFFLHSRLLERSANLSSAHGGGSITALPIVETQERKISAYIPTNLISITDGQIYLDIQLFNKGIRPAIDVGMSVSRIGGKAQSDAMKSVSETLRIDFTRFAEVEVFTRFGAHVEEETAQLIRRGERLRELLKQRQFHPVPLEEQVLGFFVLETGVLDGLALEEVSGATEKIIDKIKERFPETVQLISSGLKPPTAELEQLRQFVMEGEA